MLLLIEARVVAVERKQLVMAAELNNPAVIEDCNLVSVPHRRDAMRDQNRGCRGRVGSQAAKNAFFGVRVDTGKSIIKNENGRTPEECAGDGGTLLLPPREGHPTLTDHSIEPKRKLFKFLANVGSFGSLQYLFKAGFRRSKCKILADRFAEEKCLLRHHPDVVPENGQRVGSHGPAVDQQSTFWRLMHPRDELNQSGLA